jgi:hypothetical protein
MKKFLKKLEHVKNILLDIADLAETGNFSEEIIRNNARIVCNELVFAFCREWNSFLSVAKFRNLKRIEKLENILRTRFHDENFIKNSIISHDLHYIQYHSRRLVNYLNDLPKCDDSNREILEENINHHILQILLHVRRIVNKPDDFPIFTKILYNES